MLLLIQYFFSLMEAPVIVGNVQVEFKWQKINQNQIERKKQNKTDNRKANNMSISDTLATRELQINNNNNNNNNNNKNNKKTRTTRR